MSDPKKGSILSLVKKLAPEEGSVFEEANNELSEEAMSGIMPLAKQFIDPIMNDIKEKLGNDENIGVIRNIDGKVVIMLLKGDETDLDIKDPKTTILETIDISEISDLIKVMAGGGDINEE